MFIITLYFRVVSTLVYQQFVQLSCSGVTYRKGLFKQSPRNRVHTEQVLS